MKTIMARTPHESSFSISKRHFQWILKSEKPTDHERETPPKKTNKPKKPKATFSFRSTFFSLISPPTLHRPRVLCTLYGHRRGHVRFSFQANPNSPPFFLLELATPTCNLVREMASGLVRIALQCEKRHSSARLLEEPFWRGFCNGKKCGFAVRRDWGVVDSEVLGALRPVSMGAGVLPSSDLERESDSDGGIMYMRARFERVVGSRDSEAFYMLNPDGSGGPELSIYLLRV